MNDKDREYYANMMERMIMNRRRFMLGMAGAAGVAGGAAALAACGGTPTETPTTAAAAPTAVSLPATPTKAAAAGTTPAAATATKPAASTPAASAVDFMTPIPEEAPAALKGTGEVVVVGWGGAMEDAQRKLVFDPFTEFTGITVKQDSDPEVGKIKAMVDGGSVQWDTVQTDAFSVYNLQGKGEYFVPLDYKVISTDGIDKGYVDPLYLSMLPYSWALAYRTDVFTGTNVPHTWADFWDQTKFPGKRSLHGEIQPPVEFALIADGVAIDQVYQELSKPTGLDRAFASLDKIKANVAQWWSTGALPAQLLNDKEVVAVDAWNGRISALMAQGSPVTVDFNQGMLGTDTYGVLKGAPNPENAMKYIAYATSPRPQARIAVAMNYGFVNSKAADVIPPDDLKKLPTSPENFKMQFLLGSKWWIDNFDKTLERFNTWKTT